MVAPIFYLDLFFLAGMVYHYHITLQRYSRPLLRCSAVLLSRLRLRTRRRPIAPLLRRVARDGLRGESWLQRLMYTEARDRMLRAQSYAPEQHKYVFASGGRCLLRTTLMIDLILLKF